tara:strand:+ start:1248 stop:2711 length:1464 start_codon:yes stop_codon:yes gene_type:complete
MVSNILNYNLTYNSNLMIKFYNMILKYYKNFKIIKNNSKNSKYERFHSYIYKKLNNIYNSIKLDYNNFNYIIYRTLVNNNTTIYNNTLTNIYEKYLLHNKYVSNNIKDFIKKEKTKISSKLLIYKLPYKNTYININFFIYNERINDNSINITYDKSVTNILLLINLISLVSGNNNIHNNDICSKDGLNITFFNTPFLRTLNDNTNNVLGAKNVNGGFCFGCQNVGNIIIYRKEECFKVFTHELIHNMGIDEYFFDFMNLAKNKQSNEYKIYKNFIKNYNISNEVNNNNYNIGLQECFVEFWGEFFNNALTSFLYANSCILSNNINKFKIYKNFFTKIIQFEYIHNYYQVYKILNFNNMNYNDLIIKNVKNINYDTIVYNNFREHTHVFSYYILKLFLLIDYERFINSSISLSIIDNIYNINFLQSSNNMYNFLKFILDNSHNTKTLKNFEILEELFQSILQSYNKTQCNSLEFIIKNLRMSVLERIN